MPLTQDRYHTETIRVLVSEEALREARRRARGVSDSDGIARHVGCLSEHRYVDSCALRVSCTVCLVEALAFEVQRYTQPYVRRSEGCGPGSSDWPTVVGLRFRGMSGAASTSKHATFPLFPLTSMSQSRLALFAGRPVSLGIGYNMGKAPAAAPAGYSYHEEGVVGKGRRGRAWEGHLAR